MKYTFPKITHLNDVLPAIEGRDEFIVATRDWGYVVNYMVSMADTFPPVDESPELETRNAIRRECRGILFYPDGKIMARRLHKFFNVNERDETQHHLIDLSKPHVILEKLDGSMITPVMTDAGIRYGTKMGITDVGTGAEMFVIKHPNYQDFARWIMERGFTPIFEWCSRQQKIVVDYPVDRLVLIAVRNTVTGEYESYEQLVGYSETFGIDVVKAYAGTTSNMQHLIDETRGQEGIEGWIIRFDDGHMIKIKGDWYVRIHKTKDNLLHEKNVVDLLVNEKIDDAKSFMLDEDRKRVEEFEDKFWNGVSNVVLRYENYFDTVIKSSNMDRKEWAVNHLPTIRQQNVFTPPVIFGMFDGKSARDLVIETIRKNTGTQSRIDSVRHMWGGAQWSYYFDGDV